VLIRREQVGSQYAFLQDADFPRIFMKHAFQVEGMTCEHCEKAVVRAIKLLDRVAVVTADRVTNKVEVESGLAPEVLKQAITEEGYQVMN
jgi:copper chaperone